MNFIFTIILFMERKLKNINFLSILKPLICFTNDHIILVCIAQTTPFCPKQCPGVLAILWSNFGRSFACYFLLNRTIAVAAKLVSHQKSLADSPHQFWQMVFLWEIGLQSLRIVKFLRLYSAPSRLHNQSLEEIQWRNKRKFSSISSTEWMNI